ncbi:MAG: hypothetical protein K6T17_06875 [Fimbriimonadales bacterium]|nr:hypothetical protein [Fimbriimonadales bacterium]
MKQYEAVIEAMRQEGGFATLGRLYQTALHMPGVTWGTKTPFASIRRIVQTRPEFFKIKPGLWGLKERKEQIFRELAIGKPSPKSDQAFTRTYFQGVIVEIGNLQDYTTFIPPQDRNKPFLNKKLKEIATLPTIYSFTYEHLVRVASTVDVIWFNERQMPYAMFEVEHTTNLQNALLKFVEFRDFRTKFYVVADDARQKEFQGKITKSVFEPIRNEVHFINYDKLIAYYERLCSSIALSKELQL